LIPTPAAQESATLFSDTGCTGIDYQSLRARSAGP